MLNLHKDGTLFRASMGEREAVKRVMRQIGIERRWRPETLRSRMDGAMSLLAWQASYMHEMPLLNLHPGDAQRWVRWLRDRGLKPSTIRGYKRGASALACAVRWRPDEPRPYDVFALAHVLTFEPRMAPKLDLSRSNSDRSRRRLAVLHELLKAGMTLPRACEIRWEDLELPRGLLRLGLGVTTLPAVAVDAIEALPRTHERVLGWTAPTARLRLNEATEVQSSPDPDAPSLGS